MTANSCQGHQTISIFNLAFPPHFCHAEDVRKYFIASIFSVITVLFLFGLVTPSQAADAPLKEGEKCRTNSNAVTVGFAQCIPGLYCKQNGSGFFNATEGICTKQEVTKCTCKNPGVDSSDGTGKNEIDCPGSSPVYCKDNQTCNPAADANTPANGSIDFKDKDDAFKQKTVTGVSCTNNTKIAKCKCITGTNKFECDIDGKSDKGTGQCKADNAICTDAQDPNASTDNSTTDSYGGGFGNALGFTGGYDIKGITCAAPKAQCTCENSGKDGSGQNGFNCKLAGQPDAHDFCEHEGAACTNDTNASMVNGGGSKSKPFNGATLSGIKCGVPGTELSPAPTEPPPPSPPCKTWGADGQCAAFGSAFGELMTDPSGFVKTLFAILLSFSGGIALLLIIRAGYRLLVSQGKPEAINQARDELVAAIVGLVFLIFSFVVLQTIGVDILHLPGFGP